MKGYEILEHKADLKIRVFGRNKEELFLNAMLGMQQSLKPEIDSKTLGGKMVDRKIKRKIRVESNDLPSLLVDFLSEINFLNETKKEVYENLKFTKFCDRKLEGEISGSKIKRFGLVIKGVTWHNLEILQRKDKIWQATILFDI